MLFLLCEKCGAYAETDVAALWVEGHSTGCGGNVTQAVLVPKSVAEEQAAIVRAIERLPEGFVIRKTKCKRGLPGSIGYSVTDGWECPELSVWKPTLRAALEAAVAAMERGA